MGHGGFQETEQLPIFSKITKFQAHVSRQDRIAELTSRCFDLALTERGPTQLNIPRDMFYGDIDVTIPKPIRLERAGGGAQSLDEAAKALAGAKFPVIVAGGGVIMSDGQAEAIALAEHLSAPVVTSYLHNDSFPAKHPLMCGPLGYQGSKAAMKIIAEADVVLALGTRLGPFGTLPQHGIDYWPKAAKLIQVDMNARKLGLVKQAAVGICGDARAASIDILRRLEERANPGPEGMALVVHLGHGDVALRVRYARRAAGVARPHERAGMAQPARPRSNRRPSPALRQETA